MSNDEQEYLDSFLAALPSYQRKQFEQGFSSFTQEDWNLWTEWMRAAPEQFDRLWQEYMRLLRQVPARLREYLEREDRDSARMNRQLVPANPEGRPRKDALADEAATLKKAAWSYTRIANHLNNKYGEGTTTKENIRGLLKARRLQASKTTLPPEKT